MEEPPQTPQNTEPVAPPAETVAPLANEPQPSPEGARPAIPQPREPNTLDRMIIKAVDWAIRNPVKTLLAATALGAGALAVEDFKSPDLKQPANVSHIDAEWWSGNVQMESGALLRAAAEKNQGIGILDNNHRREEIPKFLLDHVDDIAATKGIIFLERSQSLNEGIKKFYADGNTSHLDGFSFSTQEVTDTYIELFKKCREKGVEILCYDVNNGAMRDSKAQEYFSSPHYQGAGPRRGAEDFFPTNIPPELKEGADNFHSERIADNHSMADFVRNTLAARGNPTDCTVYFVCGSYHFTNPEIPKIETTSDRIRSFLHGPLVSPQVKKDLDELVADILPEGPRKAVVTFDTILPEKDRIPDSPAPEKYSITKNSRPLSWNGPDTAEFSLKLPDAVFNRYLASPLVQSMSPEERTALLTNVKNSFTLIAKMEQTLENEFTPVRINKDGKTDLASFKSGMESSLSTIREELQKANIDVVHSLSYITGGGGLQKAVADPSLKGRGVDEALTTLLASATELEENSKKIFGTELAFRNAVAQHLPNPFVAPLAPQQLNGEVIDLSALPKDARILSQHYLNKASENLPAARTELEKLIKDGALVGPPGCADQALSELALAEKSLKEGRVNDSMVHIKNVGLASGHHIKELVDAAGNMEYAYYASKNAPTIASAMQPPATKVAASSPNELHGQLQEIRGVMMAEMRAGSGIQKPDEPTQENSRSSFVDRFVEDRRRPPAPQQEQTNGRKL